MQINNVLAGEVNPPEAVGMPIGLIRGDLPGNLVLPAPPGPVRVTSRWRASSPAAVSISVLRPMNDVNWTTRLFGTRVGDRTACSSAPLMGYTMPWDPARATRRPSATIRRRIGHLADDSRPCDVQASVQSRIT